MYTPPYTNHGVTVYNGDLNQLIRIAHQQEVIMSHDSTEIRVNVAAARTLLDELVLKPKNMIGKKMNRRVRNKATYRALRRGDGALKIMNFMSRCGAVSGGIAGVACLELKYGI